jgi:hypothetical protein
MAERSTPAPALTQDQVRHFVAVIARADELLTSAERALEDAPSLLPRFEPDVAPDERARLSAFVATARERMAAACDLLGVARPKPSISARWGAETALEFASIACADLGPDTMRGYGPVPDALARELASVSDALQALMRQGIALLDVPCPEEGDAAAEGT